MKPNHMIALMDALNERKRTTAAFSQLVDLIDHAARTNGPEFVGDGGAPAELLDLFLAKMRTSDDQLAELARHAAPSIA